MRLFVRSQSYSQRASQLQCSGLPCRSSCGMASNIGPSSLGNTCRRFARRSRMRSCGRCSLKAGSSRSMRLSCRCSSLSRGTDSSNPVGSAVSALRSRTSAVRFGTARSWSPRTSASELPVRSSRCSFVSLSNRWAGMDANPTLCRRRSSVDFSPSWSSESGLNALLLRSSVAAVTLRRNRLPERRLSASRSSSNANPSSRSESSASGWVLPATDSRLRLLLSGSSVSRLNRASAFPPMSNRTTAAPVNTPAGSVEMAFPSNFASSRVKPSKMPTGSAPSAFFDRSSVLRLARPRKAVGSSAVMLLPSSFSVRSAGRAANTPASTRLRPHACTSMVCRDGSEGNTPRLVRRRTHIRMMAVSAGKPVGMAAVVLCRQYATISS